MLAIGFDPAFIDTIVRAEDGKGNLIGDLPPAGFHHRNTVISRVAGGNAVNIAYVLSKLNLKINLVIPSNDLFDTLLTRRGLVCNYRIHDTVNETVAVLWQPGEIQFNQIIGKIGFQHFTEQIYKYWTKSEIKVSVNWGLNYNSPEWISCLWLSSCNWKFEEITELNSETVIQQALEETNLSSKLVLEPGGLKSHPSQELLMNLLKTISKSSFDKLYPIFSCNEEENEEFNELEFTTKIIHTSKNVTTFQRGSKQIFEVPKIENIKTFVGAGDSFVAGLVYQLYKNNRVDPSYAISVAQQYMTDTL